MPITAYSLAAIAGVAGAQAQPARAARLWGAAEALHETMGAPPSASEAAHLESEMAAAQAQLDEAAWDAAWNEGRAMPLEQAVAYALEETPGG